MKELYCYNCSSFINSKCKMRNNEIMSPIESCNDHSSNICEEEVYDGITDDYHTKEYSTTKKHDERFDFIGNCN